MSPDRRRDHRSGGHPADAGPGRAPDAGIGLPSPGPADAGAVPDDDRELIENLELLQNLEGASDLELLQELSLER